MENRGYEPNDRRPIAARRLNVMNRLSAILVRAGVNANSISAAGMVCGLLAGSSLWYTSFTEPGMARIIWISAALLIQLRLLANLLDGMVAIASRTASRLGELFNEVPDRVSDTAILIGLGYAAGGQPVLGWSAALLAVMTAYVRVLGKSLGSTSDYRGPMAKQQRMFLVTVICVACTIFTTDSHHWSLAAYGLGIICVGCVITIFRRLGMIASTLRSAG